MSAALEGIVAGPEEVDRACYTDEAIHRLERARIFDCAWQFVAHESELAEPGSFVTNTVAGRPVVAVKGADDRIRIFFNSCRHKATKIIDERDGRCEHLRCPYHHWTYDTEGKLFHVPRGEAYGSGFKFEDYGLIEVPRVESFHGLIFANVATDAEALVDFLGPAADYLEDVALYNSEPLTVVGAYDYTYDGNWKLLMENTLDDYHADYLHDYAFSQRSKLFDMGGTSGFQETEGERWSVDLGIHGAFEQNDDVRTLVFQKTRVRRNYVGVFPNFIALYHPIWDVTGFRVMYPLGPGKTKVTTYCLAPASASDEERHAIGERFHYSWGPGGRAGVDDVVVLRRVQEGLAAEEGGRIVISRGIERPGPRGGAADDHAVRAFWSGWRRYMLGEGVGEEATERERVASHAG